MQIRAATRFTMSGTLDMKGESVRIRDGASNSPVTLFVALMTPRPTYNVYEADVDTIPLSCQSNNI